WRLVSSSSPPSRSTAFQSGGASRRCKRREFLSVVLPSAEMCLHGAAQGGWGAHERSLPYLARDKDNPSEGNTMAHHTLKISTPLSTLRRTVFFGLISSGMVSLSASVVLAAEKLSCLPVQHMTETSAGAPAKKKIGAGVAFLKGP